MSAGKQVEAAGAGGMTQQHMTVPDALLQTLAADYRAIARASDEGDSAAGDRADALLALILTLPRPKV